MRSTATQLPSGATPPAIDERAGKYLCFRLGKEDFAIPVARVREIMPMQPLTVVAQTPPDMKGVMNLRGKMIPVIDLKVKFGSPAVEPTSRTSIVVLYIDNAGGQALVGMIVDSVSEVLTLKGSEIDDPAPNADSSQSPPLLGVAKIKGRPKFLLDSNLVLSPSDIQSLEAVLA